MNNKSVCTAFAEHRKAIGSNLYSTGSRLVSYNTTIAEWVDDIIMVNPTKYSQSTSRHQSALMQALHNKQGLIVDNSIQDVPRGTQSLIR